MDAALAGPFIKAFFEILPQLGFQKVERGKLQVQPNLSSSMEVTALVGLSETLRGNIAYAMSQETAKKFASVMMMGMPVEHLDEMAQSAIAEASNMLTANAAITLDGQGFHVNISPPTLVMGQKVRVRISQVQSLVVEIITDAGVINVIIGIEE
jgi:chemotaxis protein CheX